VCVCGTLKKIKMPNNYTASKMGTVIIPCPTVCLYIDINLKH